MAEKRRITAAPRVLPPVEVIETPASSKPSFNATVFRQPDKIVDAKSGRTLLIDAIVKGDNKRIEALLRSGASLTKCDKNGRTPLHYAAKAGHLDVITMLLQHGAPVNARDKTLATPLFDALDGPQAAAVTQLLLAAGADANICDKNDRVPLHAAAAKSGREVIKLLAAATENPARPDKTGLTALHEACKSNTLDAVQALLAARVSPFTATREGDTALHFALQRPESSVAFFLLTTEAARLSNAANLNNVTPLHLAVKNGQIDLARRLLALGADPNVADKFGMASLHHAAASGNAHETLLLLQNGADLTKGTGISGSSTPLMQAISGGNPEVVRLLLAHGADPSQTAGRATSPLLMAIYQRNEAAFDMLLQAGANPNTTAMNGQSALHAACTYGLESMVEKLLKAGANANATTNNGRTPLHILTDSDSDRTNNKLVSMLLDAGADPLKRDGYGNTPYDQAYTYNRGSVVEMFRERLAKQGVTYKPKRNSYRWDY